MIYFDSAATTLQKPETVPAAVAEAIRTMTTPGRGDYPAAHLAADRMLALRTEAAEYFGVSDPERVILTANATHGLNLAIKSLVSPGDTVVISGYEHNAVTRPLHAIGGVSVRIVNGRLFDPDQMAEGFDRAVGDGVKAVVCTHVSNVFGYALPMDDISAVCRRKGVPLIVDASQSAGVLPVDLKKWGAAYVAMPGHKGLTAPRARGCCCAARGTCPALCWRAAPEACPGSRRCRTFCRTGWRRGPTTSTAVWVSWRACALSAAWGPAGLPAMRWPCCPLWPAGCGGPGGTVSLTAAARCCLSSLWTRRRRSWRIPWPSGG